MQKMIPINIINRKPKKKIMHFWAHRRGSPKDRSQKTTEDVAVVYSVRINS